MAVVMGIFSVNLTNLDAKAENAKYNNPVIRKDTSMYAGQNVTYELVSFGNYPQAEVVTTSIAKKFYGSLDSKVVTDEDGHRQYEDYLPEGSFLLDFYKNEGDLVIDDATYKALSGNGVTWDAQGECTYNGEKYRRIGTEDLRGFAGSGDLVSRYGFQRYQWDDKYHYFKYQPIQWRILSNSDGSYLLLSDKCLDSESLFSKQRERGEPKYTWKNSNIRSWLNG